MTNCLNKKQVCFIDNLTNKSTYRWIWRWRWSPVEIPGECTFSSWSTTRVNVPRSYLVMMLHVNGFPNTSHLTSWRGYTFPWLLTRFADLPPHLLPSPDDHRQATVCSGLFFFAKLCSPRLNFTRLSTDVADLYVFGKTKSSHNY